MNNKHRLKLIDGKFTPATAGIVLHGLINYKVNYHKAELFSNQERAGKDLSNSKKRIEDLQAENNSLKEIIEITSENKQILEIRCFIEIKVLDTAEQTEPDNMTDNISFHSLNKNSIWNEWFATY